MEYRKTERGYIVKINRGEEVMSSLTALCEKEGICFAAVSAIGACDYVKVGLYSVEERKYYSHEMTGPMEITSLLGNITEKDGKPYLHLHINVADEEVRTFGGHLNECRISGTCEMFVNVFEGRVGRKIDDATGLNVFDI